MVKYVHNLTSDNCQLFINQQNGVYKQEERYTQVHNSGQSQVQIEELKMLFPDI